MRALFIAFLVFIQSSFACSQSKASKSLPVSKRWQALFSHHWASKDGNRYELGAIDTSGNGLSGYYDYYTTGFKGSEPDFVCNSLGLAYRYFFWGSLYFKVQGEALQSRAEYREYLGQELVSGQLYQNSIMVDSWSIMSGVELGQEWRWEHFSFGLRYLTIPWRLYQSSYHVSGRQLPYRAETASFIESTEQSRINGYRYLEIVLGILI